MMRATLALAGLLLGAATAAAQSAQPLTVVLPFDNPKQDARLAWLREGATVLVSEMLQAGGGAVVGRDERLDAFDRLQLPPLASLSRASSIRVGQALGASSVVVGSFEAVGDRLTVRARVINLDDGRLLPEVSGEGELSDIYGVVLQAARAILPGATMPGGDRVPRDARVFELFVRGLLAEVTDTSLAFFDQVLKAEPAFVPVRLAMWQAHTDAGESDRALAAVSAVPVTSPWSREARFRASLSLLALERYDEALSTLRTLQSQLAAAPVANAIGVAELRRAAAVVPGRATYYFSQASELDPSDGDYFFNLGYAYWMERDPKAAAYWLREAVRRDPADGDAHFVLAAALQLAGATAESARERELAHRLSSKYAAWEARPRTEIVPRGLERLHDSLAPSSNRVESVVAAAGQRDQAELATFHLDAARRAYERAADREAIDELRRALYLSPYLAEAQLLLGRLYLRGGRVAEAVDVLKIAIWSDETPAAHVALAEALLAGGDRPGALAEVDRALALDPKSSDAQQLRGKLTAPPW